MKNLQIRKWIMLFRLSVYGYGHENELMDLERLSPYVRPSTADFLAGNKLGNRSGCSAAVQH